MHPELAAEQAYFDRALEHRELAHANLAKGVDLAANPKTAIQFKAMLSSVKDVDPDEAVAFGRIDDGEPPPLYIGKTVIFDQADADNVLVLGWQAPAAQRFYTATVDDAQGLVARRTYRCQADRVLDIDEIVFAAVAEAVAEGVADEVGGSVFENLFLDDALLARLGEARSGELADIVATIQAAQYEVISRPMEQLLVVQGAPGTGKTVVGLHRVSWLLFNLRDQLTENDVLIVGPNPAFVRYISTVLPSLGDGAVVQQAVGALGPRVRSGGIDTPAVRRLKGDLRMDQVIRRALRNRERIDTGPVTLTVAGRRVTIDAGALEARAGQLANAPHNQVYVELRNHAIRLVEAELHRGGVRDMAALELTARGPDSREIDNLLDRVWPNLTAQAFLLELFSTRRQLETAAAGILEPHEIDLLSIPRDARLGSWRWSEDDVPLLDAADMVLNGTRGDYAYIVVDEAQDLSPMQLLSISRRSRTGWMTVLGDLAQATSPWAHDGWEDVAGILRQHGVHASLEQLDVAYRLPAEVHEVAMRLLPEIGPDLAVPRAVRSVGAGIRVTPTRPVELVDEVVARVRAALGTGLVGVIVPDALHAGVTRALDAEGLSWSPELRAMAAPIVVLSPEAAKGLEFDNVVVVEPAQIVDGHERGLHALFVALTRCTQRLDLVHAELLPPELGLDSALPSTGHEQHGDGAPTPAGSGSVEPVPAPAGVGSAAETPASQNGHGTGGANGSHPVAPAPAVTPVPAPPIAAVEVQREVARAVAGALMRYVAMTVQPELLPMVVEEMHRWTVAPAPAAGEDARRPG